MRGGLWTGGDTGWFTVPITGGGVAQHTFGIRRVGNFVTFRGSISGTAAGAVQVAALPEHARPSSYQWYPSSINVNVHMAVSIGVDGVVTLNKGAGGGPTTYVALSGVNFYTD